ncbi:hypothetical protein GW17_00047328 [Ensete ventricosum]|nr:hypothetical protein GW17_00047328 [Ensete ventricosum]
MDEKASKALEAMLLEHDKDSVITESFMPYIRIRYFISDEYDLHVPEVDQRLFDPFSNGFVLSVDALEAGLRFPLHPLVVSCLHHWRVSPFQIAPNSWRYMIVFIGECWAVGIDPTHTLAFRGWGFGLKWTGRDVDNSPPFLTKDEAEQVTKVLVSKDTPRKDALPAAAPKMATPTEAPRWEGSSRWRDKAVSRPRSIRDLYRVRARSQNEPFLAQEMADLPKMSGDGPLEARWATLTLRSRVWADGVDAQLFYRGALYPPLVKEIYTTSSEALLDNVVKNLVTHHHFTMGLIDRVRDFGRVVDELSWLIDELRAKVQKLKDETDSVAALDAQVRNLEGDLGIARSKAREVEQLLVTTQAAQKKVESSLAAERDAAPKRARATIAQYETPCFKFGLAKIGRVSYEYEYRVTLAFERSTRSWRSRKTSTLTLKR